VKELEVMILLIGNKLNTMDKTILNEKITIKISAEVKN